MRWLASRVRRDLGLPVFLYILYMSDLTQTKFNNLTLLEVVSLYAVKCRGFMPICKGRRRIGTLVHWNDVILQRTVMIHTQITYFYGSRFSIQPWNRFRHTVQVSVSCDCGFERSLVLSDKDGDSGQHCTIRHGC